MFSVTNYLTFFIKHCTNFTNTHYNITQPVHQKKHICENFELCILKKICEYIFKEIYIVHTININIHAICILIFIIIIIIMFSIS